jgi:hypothetical protein
MGLIVAVHGIGQQFKGESTLHKDWLPWLQDGMNRAAAPPLASDQLVCAFYGDLFRPKGTKSVLPPFLDARDVADPDEHALLELWSTEAARLDNQPAPGTEGAKARTPAWVQAALNTISQSPFFVKLSEPLLIMDLRQVRSYMNEPDTRKAARGRVEKAVTPDTRVLIGHSLGSVVAYETLCAHPDWPITTLITFGSPLGIRNLIFDRLDPRPRHGLGRWPACLRTWVNIADEGDVVALTKDLDPLFDGHIDDRRVNNGPTAHDASPYLTSIEAGTAIACALAA